MGFIVDAALGFGLSVLITMAAAFLGTLISALFKIMRIRPWMFLILGIVNSIYMLMFSVINIIFLLAILVFFLIVYMKRNRIYKDAKNPNMQLNSNFDEAISAEWGFLYTFALCAPELWGMNHIFGYGHMGIFTFYNSLNYPKVVCFALACLPIMISVMAIYAVINYGKDALIDLKKIRVEQAKRETMLNPDGLDEILNSTPAKAKKSIIEDIKNDKYIRFDSDRNIPAEEVTPPNISPSMNQTESQNTEAQDILNNILNEIKND